MPARARPTAQQGANFGAVSAALPERNESLFWFFKRMRRIASSSRSTTSSPPRTPLVCSGLRASRHEPAQSAGAGGNTTEPPELEPFQQRCRTQPVPGAKRTPDAAFFLVLQEFYEAHSTGDDCQRLECGRVELRHSLEHESPDRTDGGLRWKEPRRQVDAACLLWASRHSREASRMPIELERVHAEPVAIGLPPPPAFRAFLR